MTERLELIEQKLDEIEDEALGMRFAFMALAKALEESGALPLLVLDRFLAGASDSLRNESQPGTHDLGPVALQLDHLRDALAQMQ